MITYTYIYIVEINPDNSRAMSALTCKYVKILNHKYH